MINSIYKMATSSSAEIYPLIPEYFNGQGRGLYLYLTGSASWYIYTLLEEVLGIKFEDGDICLEPKLTSENFFNQNTIKTAFSLQAKTVKIALIRKNKEKNRIYQIKEAYLQDKQILPTGSRYLIKKEELRNKENFIRAYLV